ncbi:lytic transglycosylase domain-containing protein [Acetobacter vaccinii]|nr:lytic transglycosylase domain-containing protein [Acetobacter vaccinii]
MTPHFRLLLCVRVAMGILASCPWWGHHGAMRWPAAPSCSTRHASPLSGLRAAGGGVSGAVPRARWGLLALLAVLSACAGPSRSYQPPGSAMNPWKPYINEAALRFSIPQGWIRAVMNQESGGHQYIHGHLVRSVHGAVGLMQIKPDTYHELARRYHLGSDPYDPHDNIMAGSGYIRELYDRFGSPTFLVAYSCGPQCADNHQRRGTSLPSYARSYLAAVAPHLGDGTPGTVTAETDAVEVATTTDPVDAALQQAQAAGRYARQGDVAEATASTRPQDQPVLSATTTIPVAGPAIVWQPVGGTGNAVIQIGAFSTQEHAQRAIAMAHQASGALDHAVSRVEPVVGSGGVSVWRTRLAGLPEGQTDTICSALRQQGLSCVAVSR